MGKEMANDEKMDEMLAVKDVAGLLHVHPNTLRRWSNDGRIKAYRITSRGDRRFRHEDIARFLAQFNSPKDSAHRAR
jgi:excisionase family DNA binding protein